MRDAPDRVRKRLAWVDRGTAFWALVLYVTWLYLGVSSLLRQEWYAGVLQLLTGVVLVAGVLRTRLSIYRFNQARASMLWAQREYEKLTYVTQMRNQAEAVDPETVRDQFLRHLLN